jgi:hypothetical protein
MIIDQLIFRIERLDQVETSSVEDYFQEDVWRPFLNRFFEVIDEEATFTTEFRETWQTFKSECLRKMIQEVLDTERRFIDITDLDRLTLDYDIYDAGDILSLNDAEFKAFLKKELHKKGKGKQTN